MQLEDNSHEEQYYDALRQELRSEVEVPLIRVDDHPITTIDEISVGDNIAFTNDDTYTTYCLGQVSTINEDMPYVQLYRSREVEAFLGVDRSESNKHTTPSWELIDEYEGVSLEAILVIGDIFTKKKKLKSNSTKAIEKFLSIKKRIKDVQQTNTWM